MKPWTPEEYATWYRGYIMFWFEREWPFVLALLALWLLLAAMAHVVVAGYCKSCARPLQWRWRKRWQYDTRRFCPFHDEGEP